MRRTVRGAAIAAVLALLALGIWVWSGGPAHAAQPASKGAPATHSRGANARDHDGLLSVAIAPSVPTDPAIFGVNPGSVPWAIKHGQARLGREGAIQVNVVGLIVTTTGTNPIPFLAASVYCNGSLVAMSDPALFSTKGNAHIRADLTLPAFCAAPAVLLNPATGSTPANVLPVYIGFGGTA